MFNLLKVELHKLKTYKLFYFLIFLTILQAILIITLSDTFSKECGESMLKTTINIQDGLPNMIFIGVFVGDYIVREFTSGYIKNLIAYGHKRYNIVISKSLVCFLETTIISFTCPIILFIRNTFVNGYGSSFTLVNTMFLFKLSILMFFVYSSLTSIVVLITFLFRNSAAIVTSIIVGIDIMNKIFAVLSKVTFWISRVYNKGMNISMTNQMIITIKHNIPLGELLNIILLCLVLIIICTTLSIYIFERVDIK